MNTQPGAELGVRRCRDGQGVCPKCVRKGGEMWRKSARMRRNWTGKASKAANFAASVGVRHVHLESGGDPRAPVIHLLAAPRYGTFHEIGAAYGSVDEALRQSILLRERFESQLVYLDEALDSPEPAPAANPFVRFGRFLTAMTAGILTGHTHSATLLSAAAGRVPPDVDRAMPSLLLLRRELGAQAIVPGLRLESRDCTPVGYVVPISSLIPVDEKLAFDLVSLARHQITRGRNQISPMSGEVGRRDLATDLQSANESLDALRELDRQDR